MNEALDEAALMEGFLDDIAEDLPECAVQDDTTKQGAAGQPDQGEREWGTDA